jgi:NADPH-dependent 2,4-dienoyl-CoA reductase/sulfur reductase-like enzyme/peroxiredoxin family protein/rhodanese-related sulfurtransferase/TusA-related sulfurtransferase
MDETKQDNGPRPRKTVIIGGVAGGATCAARLRRLDEARDIVLFERGRHVSYANCGLPYHVGGVIANRDALLVATPDLLHRRYRIDVRTESEVLSIDRAKKTVTVKPAAGEPCEEPYDDLVLATGSSPVRPPLPGIDLPQVKTLWTVPDAVALRREVASGAVKTAVVVGGGFIGLETAENLVAAGVSVTIVEAAGQVMAPLDPEMALLVERELERAGAVLRLDTRVEGFEPAGRGVAVVLASGELVAADLVVLAVGARPNGQLAAAAGLAVNERGGVVADEGMRTSDPDIYAVGDVAEVAEAGTGARVMVPLAGPANKQGRIAADRLAGRETRYAGTQATSIARIFSLAAASTGWNEKALARKGWTRGKEYDTATIVQNSHAGYYPGAQPMALKVVFSLPEGKLLGAQVVGGEGVDKRIDTLAAALRFGADVRALQDLEFAYAPPFSSAKDPVNMAGYAAGNVLDGLAAFAEWDAPDKRGDAILLDVRESAEVMADPLEGAVHIPLGKLRWKLRKFDREKETIVFCASGVRAHAAARILAQRGFRDVKVYPGGMRFYRATHPAETPAGEPAAETPAPPAAPAAEASAAAPTAAEAPGELVHLDCSGMQCPGPIVAVARAMEKLPAGGMVSVRASDAGFAKDVEAWCRRTGNRVLENAAAGGEIRAVLQKGGGEGAAVPAAAPASAGKTAGKGKTIVVFDGDLDKLIASLVIANGALAMGRPVTMFFTFWGLTALRKKNPPRTEKTFVEKMFGWMLPEGLSRTKLSKMHLFGIGTAMMKRVMRKKKIASAEELLAQAMAGGAKVVACSMSMDAMGIRPEELVDGVEIGGVGTYLADAEEADVNLFV